jgi:hypothetical protein
MAANITEEHLHHLAKKSHGWMSKYDGLREKFAVHTGRIVSTLETVAGAWAGGVIEGKTNGQTVLKVPVNLLGGIALLAAGHWMESAKPDIAKWGADLNNVGSGLVGSYIAATGYAFGKRWRDSGFKAAFGGFAHPYDLGGPPVSGDLSEAQMAAIVQRMQAAAAHG